MTGFNKQMIEISSGTLFRVALFILGIWFLFAIRDVLVVLFLSIVIASALEPVGRWADRRGFPRMLAMLIIYIAVIGVIAFGIARFVPAVVSELEVLAEGIPQSAERLASGLESVRQATARYYDVIGGLQEFLGDIGDLLRESAAGGFSGVVRVFGGIVSFLSILVISFYLAAQRGGVQRVIRSVAPRKHEAYVLDLWHRTQHKLGRWLQAQLALGVMVGLLSWIGLTLLGVPFALTLAILAGILELVPYVGPVFSAIPAVIIGLLLSPALGLYVLLLYILIQQFENHVLVPAVMGRAVGLSPVTVIVALLIGAKLLGFMGFLIAVPVAAVIAEFARDFERFREEGRQGEQNSRRRLLAEE